MKPTFIETSFWLASVLGMISYLYLRQKSPQNKKHGPAVAVILLCALTFTAYRIWVR